jgi:UDP-glucose 4-epimerase
MAKVLVTGGAGFIGSHLVDRLLRNGDNVVVLDNLYNGRLENLPEPTSNLKIIVDDICNAADHRDDLEGTERLYHLAALISAQDSLSDPGNYIHTNVVDFIRLIEVLTFSPNLRIIFASSSAVYGSPRDPLRHEDDPPSPATIYGLTKLAGEQALAIYARLRNFTFCSLRLFNVYGPRQNPDQPYANAACQFIHGAVMSGKVVLYGDGTQSRDFIYVDDVIDAFVAVADGSRYLIYNVGSGTATSIATLLSEIETIAAVRLIVDRREAWPNDIRELRADSTRLTTEFALRPSVSLHDGLDRTIKAVRAGQRHLWL